MSKPLSSRTPLERVFAADIYRRAAREVEKRNDYSCNVISRICWAYKEMPLETEIRLVSAYTKAFKPERVWKEDSDDVQSIRVLMLCFMAEITECP